MNLQPMSPSPLTAAGDHFTVSCVRCGARKSSTDVLCDVDGKAGDFYCAGHCAVMAEFESIPPQLRMNDPCHPADHEWECTDGGYIERCTICGATRDYDGAEDDGRDFTPPYEP